MLMDIFVCGETPPASLSITAMERDSSRRETGAGHQDSQVKIQESRISTLRFSS